MSSRVILNEMFSLVYMFHSAACIAYNLLSQMIIWHFMLYSAVYILSSNGTRYVYHAVVYFDGEFALFV